MSKIKDYDVYRFSNAKDAMENVEGNWRTINSTFKNPLCVLRIETKDSGFIVEVINDGFLTQNRRVIGYRVRDDIITPTFTWEHARLITEVCNSIKPCAWGDTQLIIPERLLKTNISEPARTDLR